MSIEHMYRDEQDALDFLLREEFSMSEYTEIYVKLFTAMERSGQDFRTEQEKLEQAWQDLQAVPSYVEQQAAAWAAELGLEVEH